MVDNWLEPITMDLEVVMTSYAAATLLGLVENGDEEE